MPSLHPPGTTEPTTALRDADRAHVWHPFTAMQEYCREEVPIIAAAEGFHLIDTEGRRYLDGTSSLWCNVHGHRVPELDDALRSQIDRVAHSTLLGLANVPSIELARELVAQAPAGLSRVFYSDSGATAVEAALKLAYQYHRQRGDGPHERNLFVSLSGAYHGDTIGSVSLGGVELYHKTFGSLLFKTLKVPAPVTYRVPAGHTAESYLAWCDAELERVLRENHEQIAAFVIEPRVQAAAGMLVHPPGYLRRVRELTERYGILLVADEVAVGFGRTGTLFACEQEQVTPDLMCLAKGLTGGYLPLAATLATEQIYEAFLGDWSQGRTFFHGHTYTGNPLGCAVALASLRRFETHRVLENAQQNAGLLRERLQPLLALPHTGEIRQCGLMVGIELVQDRETREPFPAAWRVGHQVTLAARRRGAIIRPLRDIVVLMPPPAMPAALLDELCDIAIAAIEEVQSQVAGA